jgi:hypothetical protein
MAAWTRSGARKASEIVMLIFRALQFSRFAMLSALVVGSAISSSRQRSFLTLQSSWESTFHRGEPWMVAVRWLQREAMAPALGLPLFDLPMAIVLASRLKSCTGRPWPSVRWFSCRHYKTILLLAIYVIRSKWALMTTAKANAEAQKGWRDRRNALARLVMGTPQEIAENLTRLFGPDRAKAIALALIKRVDHRRSQ